MPRRRKPYEVVQLNVAVIYKGGAWKIADSQGNILAGVRDKAVHAALSGKAATADELLRCGEWMRWSDLARQRLVSKVLYAKRAGCDWGRRFQSMSNTFKRKHLPKGGGKRRGAKECKTWEERYERMQYTLQRRTGRASESEWHKWSLTCANGMSQRMCRVRSRDSGGPS